MPYLIEENIFKDLKGQANILASTAKDSSKKMTEASIVSECDPFKLAFFSGEIERSYGAISMLARTFPNDKNVIDSLKDMENMRAISHKTIDKFLTECFCRKKI